MTLPFYRRSLLLLEIHASTASSAGVAPPVRQFTYTGSSSVQITQRPKPSGNVVTGKQKKKKNHK